MELSFRVLKRKYYKPLKRRLARWRTVVYGEIRVHFKKHLDGGGTYFGQDFIPLFQQWNMPRQSRVFEWCAGPGFIGFSMLAHGLCRSLCLADINPAFGAATEVTPKFLSPADPAGRWTGAHGGLAFFAYSTNYLIHLDNAVIVDVEASTAMRAHGEAITDHGSFLMGVGA